MKFKHKDLHFITYWYYAMNQREWKKLSKLKTIDWTYYNKVKKIQQSLQYNQDPNAVIIHHLRDTEEQRKYNDEHYELWGFNLDDTFEYGKYVIFVTKEWHSKYHAQSEETRHAISTHLSGECNYWYGKCRSYEDKQKISDTLTGIKRSDETKKKIGDANRGKTLSDETRAKISESVKKTMTEEHRRLLSDITKSSMTEERRKSMSESQKARITPEIRQQMSERFKEICNRPEVKQRNSEIHKLLWQDENYRKKQIEKQVGRNLSYETKEKLSKISKDLWNNKEYREKVTNALKNKPHSDEHNAKVKEARKRMSEEYKKYKDSGGDMLWNDFQKWYKSNH